MANCDNLNFLREHLGQRLRDDEIGVWMILIDVDHDPRRCNGVIETNERGFQQFVTIDRVQYERDGSGNQLSHPVAHSGHSQSQS